MHENQAEFELVPPPDGSGRDSLGRVVHDIGPGNGRPAGGHNADKKLAWKMAHVATPAIMQKMIDLAMKPETEIGFRAAQLILARTFPKARNAPLVEVDISGSGPLEARLLAALQSGEMTAADVSTLLRALNPYGVPQDGPKVDARDLLRERIMQVIEAKRAGQFAAADVVDVSHEEPGLTPDTAAAVPIVAATSTDERMDALEAKLEATLRELEQEHDD